MSFKKSGLLLFILMVSGCASIPSEAPEMSAELGKRISAIEDANIILLSRFFDNKRREIDKFIEDEWVPTFAEEFFSNESISKAWDTIVRENNKKQRLTFVVKTGSKLQKEINRKRLELIQPLDDLEKRVKNRIRSEYAQARAINNSITSFLLSASRVAENRSRYLEVIGVTDEKLGSIIDQTDDAVAGLLDQSKVAADKADKAKEFISKVKSIRDSI